MGVGDYTSLVSPYSGYWGPLPPPLTPPNAPYDKLRCSWAIPGPCPDQLLGVYVRASIIGIGFWGIFYYNYKKEPPKPYSNDEGPCITKNPTIDPL